MKKKGCIFGIIIGILAGFILAQWISEFGISSTKGVMLTDCIPGIHYVCFGIMVILAGILGGGMGAKFEGSSSVWPYIAILIITVLIALALALVLFLISLVIYPFVQAGSFSTALAIIILMAMIIPTGITITITFH